jgi:hypothetical protein
VSQIDGLDLCSLFVILIIAPPPLSLTHSDPFLSLALVIGICMGAIPLQQCKYYFLAETRRLLSTFLLCDFDYRLLAYSRTYSRLPFS